MKHLIRAAEDKDEEDVFRLACQLAPSFILRRDSFSSSFVELLNDPAVCLYVLVLEEGGVVGYILGWSHRAFFANASVAWVQEIVIDPEYRREGLGVSLMSSFEQWAVARGANLVSLTSKRARDFYSSIGYSAAEATYFKKSI